ncbi:hypothetical protein [Pelomicrobium methylotrophicum]|uniref:Uncharacterized protein n=1 Tax=Pelomicrobium methylotrophicum TaxID=2602750 RepID=A0A5C7EHY3_9PROT|nr:hypothetical protein [Pelomicrobium methylotrophicum]TXF11621.1 hypothetical protein FR698_09790 [Pelomicrobium methylotrophicum]
MKSENAMFAGLTLRVWTARKYDKRVSEEVAEIHNAPPSAGRYNKRLIDHPAYERVISALGDARVFHYKNTLASHLDGWRVLTTSNFEPYSDGIRKRKQKVSMLVSDLVEAWPEAIAEARARLNGMFSDGDYPDPRGLHERFGIEVSIIPLPNPGAFCPGLEGEAAEEAIANVREQEAKAVEAAMRDLWEKLYSPVSKMVERLSDPNAIFRDSLVENLREMVEILPRLNFTGDGRFDELVQRARSLSVHQPQALRDDKALRADVAAKAAEIAAQMAAFMGGSPSSETLMRKAA